MTERSGTLSSHARAKQGVGRMALGFQEGQQCKRTFLSISHSRADPFLGWRSAVKSSSVWRRQWPPPRR